MMTHSLKWWLFAKTTFKQCSAYFISIKWMWFYLMNTICQKPNLWFFSWLSYLTQGYQMPLFWLYTYVIWLKLETCQLFPIKHIISFTLALSVKQWCDSAHISALCNNSFLPLCEKMSLKNVSLHNYNEFLSSFDSCI